MQIIAEVKTHSPFGWKSSKSWDELFYLANQIGDIVSIHTDPRWHGSFELVAKARTLTDKPILAKGIHASDADIRSALQAGATYVLVVGRLPGTHMQHCLIEPLNLSQLSHLPGSVRAVWNSRDLDSGKPKTETFAQARKLFPGWLCQASNIVTARDIQPGADAVLVGTHLPQFAQSIRHN